MNRSGILAWMGALALAAACGGTSGSKSGSTTPTPTPTTPTPTSPTAPTPSAVPFNSQGPWPVANAMYAAKDGIQETPIVAMTTDEAQNRWVATPRALYLLRPGATTFQRFDETNGLHLGAVTGRTPGPVGWAKYCDDAPIADDGGCGGTVIWGGASSEGIKTVVGGEPGEVFVGYGGSHTDPPPVCSGDTTDLGWDNCDPLRHSGKIDRVRLQADGSLEVVRFDLLSNQHGAKYWHDREMNRLAYDHFVNHATLYSGSEHGVTILFPDRYRPPNPGEWFDAAYSTYMGDHLHARVCRFDPPAPCPPDESGQRMGDWFGLAVDAQGRLWHAGKWTAGRILWDSDPIDWFNRNGAAFDAAFGDPYPPSTPVFEVAAEGHEVRMTGVTVCPDGRTWFSTRGVEDGPSASRGDALAVWSGGPFQYLAAAQVGLSESGIKDVVCMPDGRLVVAGFTTGLSIYDPAKGTSTQVRASGGLIPSDSIRQLEVDRMVSPATLHVATDGGAAAIRQLPATP
jgi:hypothetical protein